ncbi:MAG TPA: uracil-DNA glycosylase, partial [Candidatus Paceibacterota bacterium]|nr:uracil-DNA glycosylase [Candidatus Paceibacterota bacterium]
MTAMSDAYRQLLDSAIEHLQSLKAQGVRFVSVTPESLTSLSETPRPAVTTPQPISRPAAPVAPKPAAPRVAAPALPLNVPAPANASAAPLSPEAKTSAFAELRQRALICTKCPHLATSRKNVVFGVGN